MNVNKFLKKIYIILIAIILVVIAIVAILLINNSTSRVVITNDKEEKVMNTNALTMMYETEAGSGEYQVTSDTTWPQDGYIFNERLSGCENGSTITWDDENRKVLMQANTSDKCYVYFDKEANTLANYIINTVYTGTDGDNGLYYHDGSGSYTNSDQEAEDNSYRYAGANPNNYVCFGSDEETCPADNLYRVIGVFNGQVKLIESDYAGQSVLGTAPAANRSPDTPYYKGDLSQIPYYYWSGSSTNSSNIWNNSTLNTSVLNGTYLNILGSKWSNLIATTSWKVGGNTYTKITLSATPKKAYQNEIVSPAESTTYNAKVGLMYVSDYGYAASPDNWNTTLYDYGNSTNQNNNWMFMGANEWTISRRSDGTDFAYYVYFEGNDESHFVSLDVCSVRPSFYLESSVILTGGSGTETDPFRIA